jgi:hypothetical protein
MVEMYDKVSSLLLLLLLLLLDSVLGGAARVRGGGVALRGGGEGVVPPAVGIRPLTPHFLLAEHNRWLIYLIKVFLFILNGRKYLSFQHNQI